MSASLEELERLYEQALELEPLARAAWLSALSESRPELGRELAAMLHGAEGLEEFLEEPAVVALESSSTPPSLLGAFELLEELGRGGMGVVYRARQERPAREVALKLLSSGFASRDERLRFELEAAALARLAHPGIAQVYACGVDAAGGLEQSWIAMELVRGASDLVEHARANALDARGRVALVIELAEAVAHAHRNGVLHRDLKPGNVLVGEDGRVRVIDFGIARVEAESEDDTLTRAGQVLGTLAYMAPEQAAGQPEAVDARADVHAMGVLLYELLCGCLPRDLERDSITARLRALAEDAPRPAAEAQRALGVDARWVLERALANEPAERYPTADAFAEDLRALLEGRPVSAGPPSALYTLRRFVGRHRLAVGAASVVFVALLVASVVSTLSLRQALDAKQALENEQRATLDALERERLERLRAQDARDFLRELIRAPTPYGDGVHVRVATLLDVRADELERSLSSDPELAAQQRMSLAYAYDGLGLHARAIAQLDRLLERSAPLAPDQRALALGQKADALLDLGRAAEAVELRRRELALLEGSPSGSMRQRFDARVQYAFALHESGESPSALLEFDRLLAAMGDAEWRAVRLQAQRAKGSVLYDLGRLDEAEELLLAAHAESVEFLGADDPDSMQCENELALVSLSRGESEQAARQFEALYPRTVALYGALHKSSQTLVSNLAAALTLSGQGERAAELAARVRVELEQQIGTNTRSYWSASLVHAMALRDSGRLAEAADLMDSVTEGYRSLLGDAHPECARAAVHAARTRQSAGEVDSSVGAYERALDLVRESEGARSELALEVGVELANALLAAGEPERAVACIEVLQADAQAELPAAHGLQWQLPNTRGGAHLRQRDYAAAARAFESALSALEASQDLASELIVLANLAAAQSGLGDKAAAIETLGRCVQGNARLHGENAQPTLVAEANLAWAFHTARRGREAHDAYVGLLPRAVEAYPDGHWIPPYWRANYAGVLHAMGEYERAIEEAEQARAQLAEILGAEHPRTTSVAALLARSRERLAERGDDS